VTKWGNNAKLILAARYLKKDEQGNVIETEDEMLERVASHIASVEKDEDKVFWHDKFMSIMDTLEFLPNSPTLMNSGKPLGQLSACFVIPVEDNIEAIFNAVKCGGVIQKSGGGVGYSFSHIRPAGSIVGSTLGVASGPVSFMKIFNAVTETIKQGGARRGANLGTLSVSHPDIYEFVKCKEDITQFQNFNISVSVTDAFLDAVSTKSKFFLRNPHTKEKTPVDACELFDLICYQAWLTGEPGVIFIDTINKKNPIPWAGTIESTNPCLVGDTKVETVYGQKSIKSLVGRDVPVYCYDGKKISISWMRSIRKTASKQPVWGVTLDNGEHIVATTNHKFMLRDGSAVEVSSLKPGDSLMPFRRYKRNSKGYNQIALNNGHDIAEATMVLEWKLGRKLLKDECSHHVDGNKKNNSPENLVVMNFGEHSRMNILGAKNPVVKYPDCNYFSKVRFIGNLNHKWRNDISTERVIELRNEGMSYMRIANLLGCSKTLAMDRYKTSVDNHKVVSVEFYGYEDVYNGTVDEFHNYALASGVVVKNCGEQPLLPYESCCLGSIDVSKMVVNGKFDWDRLADVVSIAVRFLDNIIDVNNYPNVKIARKTRLTRKVGLGVMGWADMLIALGLRYDSDKAIKLAKRLMMNIRETAHMTSRDLGKERGFCFKQLKRRNSVLTTNAPTGTLSVLANCSSGIEPIFGKEFTKTVLNGNKLEFGDKYKGVDDRLLVTAYDVSIEKHIEMLAAFQAYTDNATSKTINAPASATVDDVKKAFLMAHSLGCKGLTIYRDGSRQGPMSLTTEGQLSECDSGRCDIL